MPPLKRFPEGPITPHGAYHVLHDRIPQMGLSSYDETVVFHMLGGLAIPDRQKPGRVQIKDISGLIPPWRHIKQKGASQDGETWVDALYDSTQVLLETKVVGKDPADARRIYRTLIDSIDAKQTSRLWWFTHDLGYWWANLRWSKVHENSVMAIKNPSQDVSLRLENNNAFWQSYPCVESFTFSYNDVVDEFDGDYPTSPGPNWTVAYNGAGTGVLALGGSSMIPTLEGGRWAVARRNGYVSTQDNQVVEFTVGNHDWWFYPPDAGIDLWARMNNTGTPGTSGIRLRLYSHTVTLTRVIAGVETEMRRWFMWIPPLPNETWRMVVGTDGAKREISIMRGGATLWTVVEGETDPGKSLMGAANRSIGVGASSQSSFHAAKIWRFAGGVNAKSTQSDFLRRVNAGDQPMLDNYICYGPGTFRFWNGPGAGVDEYVEFGPILANQVMYLRTDPRKRAVVDMTSIPNSPQAELQLAAAKQQFLSFATGNNATALAEAIDSIFGVKAPQGNAYSLLHGRWNDDAAIPPKSPGKPAEEYHVKVSIVDGNANSKIIVTGTPLRRNPY